MVFCFSSFQEPQSVASFFCIVGLKTCVLFAYGGLDVGADMGEDTCADVGADTGVDMEADMGEDMGLDIGADMVVPIKNRDYKTKSPEK